MNVIVVGCGRMGAELAYRLYQNRHEITVIDQVGEAFQNLPPDFRGRMLEGDVLSSDMLHRAGLGTAQALAAVTSADTINAVVGHVARTVYHIRNVVVRNFDPRYRPMHEAFGLQIVSSSSWGAQRMEEMLAPGALHTVFSAGNGEIEVYEMLVHAGWDGQSLHAALPIGQCLVISLTRAGRALQPTPDMMLRAGDILHLSADQAGIEAVRQRLVALGEK